MITSAVLAVLDTCMQLQVHVQQNTDVVLSVAAAVFAVTVKSESAVYCLIEKNALLHNLLCCMTCCIDAIRATREKCSLV